MLYATTTSSGRCGTNVTLVGATPPPRAGNVTAVVGFLPLANVQRRTVPSADADATSGRCGCALTSQMQSRWPCSGMLSTAGAVEGNL